MQFGYDWDIIFGNLSHQCAQMVGGTADFSVWFGSACLTSAIMQACRLQELGWLSSPGSFSFLIQKEEREKKKR